MKLRVARHTNSLKPIINFYCEILGLSVLGSFVNHDDYDGVFIGNANSDWHLEFTVSNEKPDHKADKDDALVFYVKNKVELENLKTKFKNLCIDPVLSNNPYWNVHGLTYTDPDGFLIIITI